jgi:hypothetical protein
MSVPKSLPKCRLISLLAEKAKQRNDTTFDFIAELEKFRKRVGQDSDNIKLLFPEYTPHDEEYHLRPLFHLADRILGRRLLSELNATELFLLACALYGHDWGMAVSNPEKIHISTGKLPDGENIDTLWIIPNEQASFVHFAREQGFNIKQQDSSISLPIHVWREYIRQTHAIRSSERIRRYFEKIDTGVALRLSRICESHYLDLELLRDPDKYPVRCSVLGEVVNVRALSIYLRLIDMLDLADNRTPYVIWEFVAPREPRSVMEWNKHRALRQVTCPRYQKGERCILVDGSTSDHEVYATLEDLRIYCEKQFRGCKDILAEMPDYRYALDVSHIRWKVEAEGFRPISMQFEFDREKMLDFLGEELYGGDRYVFLRELLQNSIDAIRMRRSLIKANEGRELGGLGEIRVTVEHCQDTTNITWQDDGIGMDENILRNYLAVLGKSYYRSDEFMRLGIPIDPISYFGIGILTCFMVADSIEIVTYKDRNLPPPSELLRIRIPAVNRQFRVETMPGKVSDVGTTIKLSIAHSKISSHINNSNSSTEFLNVTEYLSRIAGFVEFPIIITEDDRKTIILHPYHDKVEVNKRFGAEYSIKQLNLDYPWEEAILPPDLPVGLQVFSLETFDLHKDLGLEEYEGVFSYPVPNDISTDFNEGLPGTKTNVLAHKKQELVGQSVRWRREWHGFLSFRRNLRGRNDVEVTSNAIYRDGILLSKASFNFPASTNIEYIESADASQLVINIPKSRTEHLDLARTKVIGSGNSWAGPIFEAHLQCLSRKYFKELIDLPPQDRLAQLARFVVFHNVSVNRLWNIFPREYWPLPFLENGGEIQIKLWPEVANSDILVAPEPLTRILNVSMHNLFNNEQSETILANWLGGQCLVDFATWSHTSETLKAILEFVRWPLGTTHQFSGVRFLSPPWKGNPPLLQEVWSPMEVDNEPSNKKIEQILIKAIEYPVGIKGVERVLLFKRMSEFLGMNRYSAKIAQFPKPFDKYFAYENDVINLGHPATQALIRLTAKIILSIKQKQATISNIKNLDYMLHAVFHGMPSHLRSDRTYEDWERDYRDLWHMLKEIKLVDITDIGNPPTAEEFVPGSRDFLDIKVRDDWNEPFGDILK